MAVRDEPTLTPLGRSILEATYRGRVSYLTGPQIVVMRQQNSPDVLDVSKQFVQLARAGWAVIEAYDPDELPVPVVVPCHTTVPGEDALMEAAAAAKKRKAKQ